MTLYINKPTIDAVRELRTALGDDIYRTPLISCPAIEDRLGNGTRVHAKLEFLQKTGTFKARGALAVIRSLTEDQLRAGVTAVSAGNHAIATAYASAVLGTSAKVVMIKSASPARIESCRAYGAEVVFAEDVHEAFRLVERIKEQEGRFFVHPFEGPLIAAGTGTVGLEVCEQCDDFDTVIVPVGGGGLIGGMSNAIKQIRPDATVIGVEPTGADTMHRSFASGKPEAIDTVQTIADSLGAPFAMPFSYQLCQENVDALTRVSDDQLREAMGFLFEDMKIAVEPACAASTAALLGPLRGSLKGQRVILTMCGSNTDWATFASQAKIGGRGAD